MAKLSERHKAFVNEYLINGRNGTKAYMSVYKSVTSEDSAKANASRLLTKDNVKEYLEKEQEKLQKKTDINKEFILGEYMELLDSCKVEGIDGYGTIKDRTNWAKALSQLTKMLGLDAPDKSEVEHKGLTINILKPNKED